MSSALFAFIVFVASFSCAFWYSGSTRQEALPSLNDEAAESQHPEAASESVSVDNPELVAAFEKITETAPSGSNSRTPAEIAESIDQLEPSDEEARLIAYLGSRPMAGSLRRLVIGANHADRVPDFDVLLLESQKLFQEQPGTAAKEIKDALKSKEMSKKTFSHGRATLIFSLAGLSGYSAEAQKLAVSELTENVVELEESTVDDEDPSERLTNQAMMPVVMHGLAIQSESDAGKALAITVDGIVAQLEPSIRMELARQFLGKFASSESALREALGGKGIEISGEIFPTVQTETEVEPEASS